jgi:hypothetical protein
MVRKIALAVMLSLVLVATTRAESADTVSSWFYDFTLQRGDTLITGVHDNGSTMSARCTKTACKDVVVTATEYEVLRRIISYAAASEKERASALAWFDAEISKAERDHLKTHSAIKVLTRGRTVRVVITQLPSGARSIQLRVTF